ncbi:twin-arginine translocation signal domain-containing protein, partial [uncultured Boseongicola sp.]|uniref:twin-arginine translocation signal domain-containing protein n=1 Tax=uncultured Boseongicola sp. TaxID=1648499 RepID=UPI00262A92FE
MVKRKSNITGKGVSRRKFVGGAAGAAAASSIIGFPNIVHAADPIRSIGLGVSIINEIQSKASDDLGFGIRGQALGYGALFGKTLNQNDQYEVSECYFDMFD